MISTVFKVRNGWYQRSNFHPFTQKDVKDIEKFHSRYDEESVVIKAPSSHRIELSWYTQFDNKYKAKKCYLVGKVVFDKNWHNPIEQVTLKTFKEAIDWVNKWIKKIEKIEDKKVLKSAE